MSTAWRQRRVLFVSSSYPFHQHDVHALFVHDFARALVDAGAQVSVLTPCTPQTRERTERWDGVDVQRFSYPGLNQAPITGPAGLMVGLRTHPARSVVVPGFVAAMAWHARRALARLQPDVVVSHWLLPSGIAVALAQPRCAVVHLAHSSDVHLLAGVPGRGIMSALLRRTGVIAATSAFLAERMRSLRIADGAPLVPLGAPLVTVAARREVHSPIRVCTMGRLIAGKGIERLLDVAGAAPDLSLTIAGEGPRAAAIDAQIGGRGLAPRVARRGFVLGKDKAAFFAAHDVFAFVPDAAPPAAFQDNLPVVVLEALAHGLPVVATRVGALPELLGDGAGALVGATSTDVVDAIRALATPGNYQLASEAALRCARARSWPRSLDALERACGASEGAALHARHQDLA